MPQGILIDLNDGRPRMEITAGLRAPAVTGSLSGNSTFDSANGTRDFGLTMTQGSAAFILPTKAIDVYDFDFIPEVYFMNGFSRVNNSTGRISIGNFNGSSGHLIGFGAQGFEVLGASPGSEGIFVSDSTNFTAITSNSRLLTAQYVGTVTVNGSYTLPVTGIPFGRWNNPNVTLEFDGARILCRNNTYTGIDNVSASVTIDLVIFNNTAPTAGPGLTMSNASGQIVFSSVKRPFVLSGFLQLSNSYQSIGNGFFPILRCGAMVEVTGGYNNLRYKGVAMSNGQVRAHKGSVYGNYSTQSGAQFPFNTNISMRLPYIPNMY